MTVLRIFIYLISLTFLSSCANVKPIAKDWSNKLREYQINPIFPPREDVYVGDVYLTEISKEKSGSENKDFLAFGTLLSYINLQNDTSVFYSTRPNFPSTVKETSEKTGSNIPETISDTYKSSNVSALKKVIFPDFLASSAEDKGLSASIPGQTLAAVFGLNSKNIESASISIPQAESYAYPALSAYKKLQSECKDNSFKSLTKTKDIFLITEVYYTRQMTITIDQKSTSGANGQAILTIDSNKLGKLIGDLKSDISNSKKDKESSASDQETTEKNAAKSADSSNVSNASVAVNKEHLDDILAALEETKSNLNKINSEANLPGIGFWNIKSIGSRVFVNATFDKPIAIGYRGLKLNGACNLTATSVNETEFNSGNVGSDNGNVGSENKPQQNQ